MSTGQRPVSGVCSTTLHLILLRNDLSFDPELA